jgi:hypothetical protein
VTRTNVRPERGKDDGTWGQRPQFDAKKAIENALILDAELPSIQLAERLAREALADPVFIERYFVAFFLRSLTMARRKAARARHEQYQLPGFEHLPFTIRGENRERCNLLDANYKAVRAWFKGLNTRRKDDPEFNEAKGLAEKMRIAAKKDRGITVRRALGLQERKT